MEISLHLFPVLFLCLLQESLAITFPFSASDFKRECIDMFPESLKLDAQTSEPPFEITVSDSIYEGVPYEEVALRADGEYHINAFFLQARVADCSSKDIDVPIGYFREEPLYVDDVEMVNCGGKDNSAVMSKKWALNKKLIKVRWHKPKNERRKLYFRATIVANKNLFWMDNFSTSIRSLGKDTALQFCPIKTKYTGTGSGPSLRSSLLTVTSFFIFIPLFF